MVNTTTFVTLHVYVCLCWSVVPFFGDCSWGENKMDPIKRPGTQTKVPWEPKWKHHHVFVGHFGNKME